MRERISPALEDYLESIFIIQNKGKPARVKDIAALIKVKAPSVIEALSHLQKKDLVIHERYGFIELTPDGLNMAKKLYERHTMLKKFFHQVLGIDKDLAEEDACRIEHYLSPDTLKRILSFIQFIEYSPKKQPEWLKNFQYYLKHKKVLKANLKKISKNRKNNVKKTISS